MLRSVKTHCLVSALQNLLSDAILEQIERKDWRSVTFEGEQITITFLLPGETAEDRLHCFSETLPNHEFTLPRWFVADIAVIRTETLPEGIQIYIEALLIEA